METILTFDVSKCKRLRSELARHGWKEGTQFRIGMGEKPYQMTLRAPSDHRANLLRAYAEEALKR